MSDQVSQPTDLTPPALQDHIAETDVLGANLQALASAEQSQPITTVTRVKRGEEDDEDDEDDLPRAEHLPADDAPVVLAQATVPAASEAAAAGAGEAAAASGASGATSAGAAAGSSAAVTGAGALGGIGLGGLAIGAVAVAAVASVGSSSGGTGTGTGTGDTPAPQGDSGVVVNGYLSGARVARENGSGNVVFTDANGQFTGLTGNGPIVVTGGTNISTGQPFTGQMRAPEGASVVTPLTTLVFELTQQGVAQAEAVTLVLEAFNLANSFDLLNVDPAALAEQGDNDALAVLRAGVEVATVLQAIGGDEEGFTVAAQELARQIREATDPRDVVAELADQARLQALRDAIKDAAPAGVTLNEDFNATTLAPGVTSIRNSDSLESLAQAQRATLETQLTLFAAPTIALEADTGTSNRDGITSNGVVAVSGVRGGATWEYSTDRGQTWNNGTGASFTLVEGVYAARDIRVRQTLEGETSGVSANTARIEIDTTAPTVTSTFSVDENTLVDTAPKSIALAANESVTWSNLTGTDAGSFTLGTGAQAGQLLFTGATDFETKSSYTVTLTATDAAGNLTTQDITININDVNEAPTAVGTIAAQTAVLGQSAWSLNVSGNFADVDADDAGTYSLTAGTLPAGLTLNAATGVISGTPTATATPSSFTITRTDRGGLTANQTFDLQVVEAPAVNSFTVADATGNTAVGKGGDMLTFTVTMSEAVNVTGTPQITFSVNGQEVVANYTGGTGTNTLTFTGAAPTTGNGSAITLASINLNGGSIVGSGVVTNLPLLTNVTGQTFAGYTVDNTPPVVTSTFSVDENTLVDTAPRSIALAANESVTWSNLTGTDAASFTLGTGAQAGQLLFTGATDFETKSSYTVTLTATDAAGNVTTQAITININDVNEAPTAVGTIAAQTAVLQSAWLLNVSGNFADVDAGSNGQLTFSAAGLPAGLSINPSSGVISGTPTAAIAGQPVTVTATDGGGLSVTQSFNLSVVSAPALATTLGSATNLDVRSNIVLTVSEEVVANAGGTITLVDLGGPGFRGENTIQTQTISANDTNRVSFLDNNNGTWSIIINPEFDLDLSSNYRLEISAGAFQGQTSGQASVAFTPVTFSTVTPGVGFAAAAQSQIMNDSGALVSSLRWFDASDIGNPSTPDNPSTFFDFGGAAFAAVFKSVNPADAELEGDSDMRFLNFGADDLVYFDHQDNLDVSDARSIWQDSIFAGGNGSAQFPLLIDLAGTGILQANTIRLQIEDPSVLPTPIPPATYANVVSNNWSDTGVVIIG